MASDKHVTLHYHHAKPYRKRHIGFLVLMITSFLVLSMLLVQYRDQLMSGLVSSRSFISDMFTSDKNYDVKVSSNYGFNVTYDQKQFYASAINGQTGDLYIGSELSTERAYSIVRIAPNWTAEKSGPTSTTALTLTYHPGEIGKSDSLGATALQDGGLDARNLTQVSKVTTLVGGKPFEKTTWQSINTGTIPANLSAKFITYSGLVRGNVVTIVISLGISRSNELQYDPLLSSLSFDNRVSLLAAPTLEVVTRVVSSRSVLDVITNTSLAAAATSNANDNSSEKVAALYSPAVAKIYNAYCMDISIDKQPYITAACSGASGSGFFVSNDGYIGTNGHVAVTTPLDIVISDAVSNYVTKGNPTYFNFLLKQSTLKASDVPAGSTDIQKFAIYINALYGINASRITATNNVQNLLVGITNQTPDITALLKATHDRKPYTGDKNVLTAKLSAYNFRANDGFDGYKASDVAIIKVDDGSNYPIVKLGSIDTVTQGADLMILGYPGNASKNGIVESTSSQASLTTGKVSAIKNAAGSDKKLIETDTTIGHGNSGGPAIDSSGSVVGIATYTADGSGSGNGVYNYIRDIKDFIDLASTSNIAFNTTSKTQSQWEIGIDNFYSSHYSKAVKNFQAVLVLYPNHSRAAEFITAAQKRISSGEDVVDFPLVPVIVAASILLVAAGTTVFIIVRHHKKHLMYKAGIAQGTVQPTVPGDLGQQVTVTPIAPIIVETVTPIPTSPAVVAEPLAIPVVVEPATPPIAQPEIATVVPETPPVNQNPWLKPNNDPPKQ